MATDQAMIGRMVGFLILYIYAEVAFILVSGIVLMMVKL